MPNLHPARKSIVGFSFDQDRLWLIHTPEFTAAITEYNDELTGYDPRLVELNPKVFCYGGNAYYITGRYAERRGWRVEAVEDRR
jgi:hypothetical protein